jgi:type I restriction enzyme R subunit
MSELLDALIEQRKQDALDYQEYLRRIVELTKKAKSGPSEAAAYTTALDTPAKRALYDNLEQDEALALAVDGAVHESRQDDWRGSVMKTRRVKFAIKRVLGDEEEALVERILELVKNQHEY